MRYIQHILVPSEQVIYDGHVHPRVLAPGFLWLAFAALILHESSNTGGGHSLILWMLAPLANWFPSMQWLYNLLLSWQKMVPGIALEIKITALGIALYGLYRFVTQLIIMMTTELVITNFRVIAKTGLTTVLTIEMDRRRIAGIVVQQSLMGRLMNYGNVFIQGFNTSIGNLPVLVKPHMIEKFLS